MCPGMGADSTDLGVPKRRREGKSAPQVKQLLAGPSAKPCWVACMPSPLPLKVEDHWGRHSGSWRVGPVWLALGSQEQLAPSWRIRDVCIYLYLANSI